MKRLLTYLLLLITGCPFIMAEDPYSTREERVAVAEGNKAYEAKNYKAARDKYKRALASNPQSLTAHFNLGMALVRIAEATPDNKKQEKQQLMEGAKAEIRYVSERAQSNPSLAARAFYNLGNMAYNAEDYQTAADMYKQALRLNPGDNRARKNLRLAQKKLKEQKKDDKKDRNKQQPQNQQQPQQDKKDQNKQQPQNQQQNQPQQQQPQQPQQQPKGGMSQQAADRILKHSSDKEKETLKRMQHGNQQATPPNRRRW